MSYQPPYVINTEIIHLISRISEAIGQLTVLNRIESNLKLRKINQIKTIQGSLAIEGNTLSIDQITAILNNKPVIAPVREIQEVKNALKVYEKIEQWRPYSEKDLLKAHQLLMVGLIEQIGEYRTGGVGVMSGKEVIHVAPPANQVGRLMQDLFNWIKNTKEHPLISSCVFHYEFEFIHPFADGNGRMGRLWQTLILSKWNPLFIYIPVESLIHQSQQQYYQAIQKSTEHTDSAYFIEFMLKMLLQAIESSQDTVQVSDPDTVQASDQVKRLISKMQTNEYTLKELMGLVNISHKPTFRKNYLNPAISLGLILPTRPDTPNSPLQKYKLSK